MKKTVFYAVLCMVLSVQSVFAHEFVATITKINDGDTFTALVNNETTKIRLLDVDCYETQKNARANFQQKYYGLSLDEVIKNGKQSRKKLKNMLKNHLNIKINRRTAVSFCWSG